MDDEYDNSIHYTDSLIGEGCSTGWEAPGRLRVRISGEAAVWFDGLKSEREEE
jgi:hypothetical protein